MIIYTPVPPEILWYQSSSEDWEIKNGKIEGVLVELKLKHGDNKAVIERVLSTDPAHFLKTVCQPGREIIF